MSEPGEANHAPGSKFFAVVLMAVGALICALCGLCTIAWLASYGSSQEFAFRGASDIVLALIFGGIPIVVGVGVFVVGLRLYRQP